MSYMDIDMIDMDMDIDMTLWTSAFSIPCSKSKVYLIKWEDHHLLLPQPQNQSV